jgi:hypothetical protein
MGRLAVGKCATQTFDTERLSLKKLNEVGSNNSIGLKHQIGLQLWENSVMIWTSVALAETITDNINISAKKSLGYSGLKDGFSELLDQRKEAKLQWLHDLSQVNGDNPNSDMKLAYILGTRRGNI